MQRLYKSTYLHSHKKRKGSFNKQPAHIKLAFKIYDTSQFTGIIFFKKKSRSNGDQLLGNDFDAVMDITKANILQNIEEPGLEMDCLTSTATERSHILKTVLHQSIYLQG